MKYNSGSISIDGIDLGNQELCEITKTKIKQTIYLNGYAID
jgi:hypothetical protein